MNSGTQPVNKDSVQSLIVIIEVHMELLLYTISLIMKAFKIFRIGTIK